MIAGARASCHPGELLDAVFVHLERSGEPADALHGVVDEAASRVCTHWREKDRGFWGTRGPPRHFVYSKIMCWAAVDRALAIGERHGGRRPHASRWSGVRDEIRADVFARGIDPHTGAFRQAYDGEVVDASALRFPAVGFMPDEHPAMLATVHEFERRLVRGSLVQRHSEEEAPGSAFVPAASGWPTCSHGRRRPIERARSSRVCCSARDPRGFCPGRIELGGGELVGGELVGGELVGGCPQAASRVALIRAALAIAEGRRLVAPRAAPLQTRGSSVTAPASR